MPALTAAWEYAKEDVTTRLPGWQSADHLGNGIYYEKRWVPSIEAATGGVVEVGVRGLPTTRFNWLLIQHFISDTDATRVYAGGSDHPIYTLRDLSVCVDPRSTGATGIPVRLVVLTTTAVKTGVAGPWGQADAQKKNYDVEFELNRLIFGDKARKAMSLYHPASCQIWLTRWRRTVGCASTVKGLTSLCCR